MLTADSLNPKIEVFGWIPAKINGKLKHIPAVAGLVPDKSTLARRVLSCFLILLIRGAQMSISAK
jgi:hypothetical protein